MMNQEVHEFKASYLASSTRLVYITSSRSTTAIEWDLMVYKPRKKWKGKWGKEGGKGGKGKGRGEKESGRQRGKRRETKNRNKVEGEKEWEEGGEGKHHEYTLAIKEGMIRNIHQSTVY